MKLVPTQLSFLLLLGAVATGQDSPPDPGRPAGARQARMVAPLLARAADADRSGEVTEAEWKAFVAALEPDAEGRIEPRRLQACLILQMADRNGDGIVTVTDLDAMFAALDGNGDKALQPDELQGRRGALPGGGRDRQGRASGVGQMMAGTLGRVLARFADADDDGSVTTAEWQALIASFRPRADGALDSGAFTGKLLDEEPAADRREAQASPGAFTWKVYLMTLDGQLDVDGDGVRGSKDLQAVFDSLDRNRDRVLQADEIAGPRGGPPGAVPGGRAGRGGQGWQTATPEQKARPCLMPWQRSLEDALAVVARTGKPLLICVNMDGEPASESLAWLRYRDPDFVKLAHGFVPLIVSPDRHNVRDWDDAGRRIPDPRFGRVIDREHIDIEPLLFEKYFQGQRVAPRHLAVDKDGKILFDIYLTQSLDPVDAALAKFGVTGTPLPAPEEMSESALLDSPDAGHRDHLEARFAAGDEATRRRIAAALAAPRSTQQPELLRMALRDADAAVRRLAVEAVIVNAGTMPAEHFVTAWRIVADDPAPGARLADALYRTARATDDETARKQLLSLQRRISGFLTSSTLLDIAGWRAACEGAAPAEPPPSEEELAELDDKLAELDRRVRSNPDDRELQLAVAAATMRYARIRLLQKQDPTFLLEDVRAAARRANRPERPSGPALAYLAWASWLLDDADTALDAAIAALARLTSERGSPLAAEVLQVFTEARTRVLYAAIEAGTEWPSGWIADTLAAHEILIVHPAVGAGDVPAYLEWLGVLEAYGRQGEVLRRALAQDPLAGTLHEYLRSTILRDRGARALEETYEELLAAHDEDPTLLWYAGLASLVAAERQAENRQAEAAIASYRRSDARFGQSVARKPDFTDSANHYRCLALCGRARLATEAGRWAEAIEAIVQGLGARPESREAADGLGRSPLDNAGFLLGALKGAGRAEDAARLEAALEPLGIRLDAGGDAPPRDGR